MQNKNVIHSINPLEVDVRRGFVRVVQNFLGNEKSAKFVQGAQSMPDANRRLGANMSIKVHFFHNHLDRFPANCGDVSNKQGERFHQGVKEMETRYRGRWDARMMADYYYCWSIKRDNLDVNHSRQSRKRKFLPKHSNSFIE